MSGRGEEVCGNVREALGETKLQELGKVVERHLLGDARAGEREGYAGARGANNVERLGGVTSSAHPCIGI